MLASRVSIYTPPSPSFHSFLLPFTSSIDYLPKDLPHQNFFYTSIGSLPLAPRNQTTTTTRLPLRHLVLALALRDPPQQTKPDSTESTTSKTNRKCLITDALHTVTASTLSTTTKTVATSTNPPCLAEKTTATDNLNAPTNTAINNPNAHTNRTPTRAKLVKPIWKKRPASVTAECSRSAKPETTTGSHGWKNNKRSTGKVCISPPSSRY